MQRKGLYNGKEINIRRGYTSKHIHPIQKHQNIYIKQTQRKKLTIIK